MRANGPILSLVLACLSLFIVIFAQCVANPCDEASFGLVAFPFVSVYLGCFGVLEYRIHHSSCSSTSTGLLRPKRVCVKKREWCKKSGKMTNGSVVTYVYLGLTFFGRMFWYKYGVGGGCYCVVFARMVLQLDIFDCKTGERTPKSGWVFHPQPPSLLILLSEPRSERKVLSKEAWFSLLREWKSWKLQWEQFLPWRQVLFSKNYHLRQLVADRNPY